MKAVFFLMFCLRMVGEDINGLEMKRIKPPPELVKHKGLEENHSHWTEVQRDDGGFTFSCVSGGSRRNDPRRF